MEQEDKQRLKRKIQEERGYWHPFHEYLLERRPGFLAAYLDFQQEPIRSGVLERKLCEFIYIAIDTATTHLHAEGARIHIRNALNHGATKEEIMEIFQCVSVLGMHALTEGGPMLLSEANKAAAAAE